MKTIEYYFKATKRCNLACPYCHEKESYKNKQALTPPLIKKILLKIFSFYKNNKLKNRIRFCYSGGELLSLGKKWLRTVLELQKEIFGKGENNCTTTIQTNLTLLDQEWVELLKENNINIGASLDLFAKTRPFKGSGEDSAQVVLDKLIMLAEAKLSASLIVVITRQNFNRGKEIYRAMNKTGIDFHTLPLHLETIKYCPELEISPEEYAQCLIDMAEEYLKPSNRIRVSSLDNYIALVKHGYRGAGAGLCSTSRNCLGNRLFFENTGETYYCGCFTKPEVLLGNIFQDSIEKMLERMRNKQVFRKLADRYEIIKKICKGCAFLSICNGGCPFAAYQEGNMFLRSEYYCRLNRRIFSYLKKLKI